MSDTDDTPDEDAPTETTNDEDTQPPIDDDEKADVDLDSLADEIEEDSNPDQDDDDTDDDVDQEESDVAPGPADSSGGKWGDMYVGICTAGTNWAIDEYGDEDSEHVDEEHFREIDLDHHFNETLQEMGASEDMPPQQALVVGTILAVGGPILIETDLLSQAAAELQEGDA